MNETTPWTAMLGASLRAGLAPAAFWRLSLKEWRTATGVHEVAPALSRAGFDGLLARFPDHNK